MIQTLPPPALECCVFFMVLELMPRPGFVGDDLTDQGGFQSVEEQGVAAK
jgi:hypothetical protein